MQQTHLIETRAVLDTPEGVQLTFHLAGPALRAAAYAIDVAIRVVFVLFVGLGVSIFFGSLGFFEISGAVFLILIFLADWAYGAVFEWLWNGRTPGKRIFHLRVIKTGGYPIGFYEAVLRNFLRAGDAPMFVLYGVGLCVMMSTRRLQRLGDLVAGTMVILEQSSRVRYRPRNMQLVPPIERSECRLGYHVSERTLDVISRLFERTGYLSGPRREAIAMVLAGPIADRLGFDLETMPPEDRGSRFLIRVLRTFSKLEAEGSEYTDAPREAAQLAGVDV